MEFEEALSIVIQYKQILFVILALFGLLIIILVDDIKSVQIISALVICGIVIFHNIELIASIPDRLKENKENLTETVALKEIAEQEEKEKEEKEEQKQTVVKKTVSSTETTNASPTKKFLKGIWKCEDSYKDITLQFTEEGVVGLYIGDATMVGTYTLSGNYIQMDYNAAAVGGQRASASGLTLYFKPHEDKRKFYAIMDDGTTLLFSKVGGL